MKYFLTILFVHHNIIADTIDITKGNADPIPIAINTSFNFFIIDAHRF